MSDEENADGGLTKEQINNGQYKDRTDDEIDAIIDKQIAHMDFYKFNPKVVAGTMPKIQLALAELQKRSSKAQSDISNTQLEISHEQAKSAVKYATSSTRTARVAIGISVVAILITGIFSYISSNENAEWQIEQTDLLKTIDEKLKENNAGQDRIFKDKTLIVEEQKQTDLIKN